MRCRTTTKIALLCALLGGPAYAEIFITTQPPSQHEVLIAIENKWLEGAFDGQRYYSIEEIRSRTLFPLAANVDKCELNPARRLKEGDFRGQIVTGYECVYTVHPNAAGSFTSLGFFYHNGMEWRMEGATHPPEYIEAFEFEEEFSPARITPKDGAINYYGLAGRGEDANPYDKVLGR